jgi:hypothetical protein
LADEYEKANNNTQLRYHINNSNVHCLLEKMNDLSIETTKKEAFELCWNSFVGTTEGQNYFQEL